MADVASDQQAGLSARVLRLENKIQEYAWGSADALAQILASPNTSGRPQAELWMGAHAQAPSRVQLDAGEQSLAELIQAEAQAILGTSVANRFAGKLPFLFKVLAAAEPLSIQAHPDLATAAAGYEREALLGLAPDAPTRNYKDGNHKPELICALTEFWALNGFRPVPEVLGLFDDLGCAALSKLGNELRQRADAEGLRQLFTAIMALDLEARTAMVAEVRAAAARLSDTKAEMKWLVRVADLHPSDPGVLCTLLLNLIRLEPGQAMYLPAGQLHAYLEGVGVELMASSDNVLRGGLTPKNVDLEELLRVVRFGQDPIEILEPVPRSLAERVYETPASEFELSVIDLSNEVTFESGARAGVEILLCLKGAASIRLARDGSHSELAQGQSVLIPDAAGAFQAVGEARIYRAAVPLIR